VVGWGIVFICSIVLYCAGTQLESGPVTTDQTTTVLYSYKSLRNYVKPVHSLKSYLLLDMSAHVKVTLLWMFVVSVDRHSSILRLVYRILITGKFNNFSQLIITSIVGS